MLVATYQVSLLLFFALHLKEEIELPEAPIDSNRRHWKASIPFMSLLPDKSSGVPDSELDQGVPNRQDLLDLNVNEQRPLLDESSGMVETTVLMLNGARPKDF